MSENVVVWVHGDCLSPHSPALQAYPDAPALWVWDDALLNAWDISLKRIVFIYESLLELPVTIRRGDVVDELRRFVEQQQVECVVTVESPSPRFVDICRGVEKFAEVEVLPVQPFLVDFDGQLDLKRFSRYWRKAQRYAMG